MAVLLTVMHFAASFLVPVLLAIFFAALLIHLQLAQKEKNTQGIGAVIVNRFVDVDCAFSSAACWSIDDRVGIEPGRLQRAVQPAPGYFIAAT
jgi:hypothetical protein